MPRKSFNDPGHAHYLTFSCYRSRQMLTDNAIRLLFAQSLDAARQSKEFSLWAYAVMPEHVHLLIYPHNPDYCIGEILRGIKEPFTKRVIAHWKEINPVRLKHLRVRFGQRIVHRFWQPGGGFDRNIFTTDKLKRAVEYIERNPVRLGFAEAPIDWPWSSARAHAGMKDVAISIDPIEFPVHNSERDGCTP